MKLRNPFFDTTDLSEHTRARQTSICTATSLLPHLTVASAQIHLDPCENGLNAKINVSGMSKLSPRSHFLNIRQKVEEFVFAGTGQVGCFQNGHHGEVLIV